MAIVILSVTCGYPLPPVPNQMLVVLGNTYDPRYVLDTNITRDENRKRHNEHRIVNVQTVWFPYHELELSHVPERRGVVEAR